jgi:hypothetical protein
MADARVELVESVLPDVVRKRARSGSGDPMVIACYVVNPVKFVVIRQMQWSSTIQARWRALSKNQSDVRGPD